MKNQQKQAKTIRAEEHKIDFKKTVLIGGSAGSFSVISGILNKLEKNLPAAIIVVMHLSENVTESLIHNFSKSTDLPVSFANNGEKIRPGQVYVA
ncbi:MAG TPA: chemotaxis protein CheB, partial [Prolixibacteraceae bacterium]|nr:chemotaxis protein CheB [Prolixibacteraceae bacterium]